MADLVEALLDARTDGNPEGALTLREMVAQTGFSRGVIVARLEQLKAAGQLEVVKVSRERLDGQMQKVSAYRLKENDEAIHDER